MITNIRIINFRQIKDESIDLDPISVVVGPNNGGKTTFLQAIALFALTARNWGGQLESPKNKRKKTMAITLYEILNIPISEFNEIWTNQKVRKGRKNNNGKPITKNIHIEIHAEGSTRGNEWKMGFEYDYGRDSLIYARPAKNEETGQQYVLPNILMEESIGYLPSVAALKPFEDKLGLGSILRHIGTGNTADVLRNTCYYLYNLEDKDKWKEFTEIIYSIFRIKVDIPRHMPATGLLTMSYSEKDEQNMIDVKNMDLSSLGSGNKQTILLFAYILALSNTIILLDEPDAHLETIRQSTVYDRISDLAKRRNNQVIIVSHSEGIMNRAFEKKDRIISCVFGAFKNIDKNSRMEALLSKYGYEEYIIVRQHSIILYGEGSTDFDFLKAFCKRLDMKDLLHLLETKVYFHPLGGNDINIVRQHFAALKEFIPELRAYAIFDNLESKVENKQDNLKIKQWDRREIENYLPLPDTIYSYAEKELSAISRFTDNDIRTLKEITENSTVPDAIRDLAHNFWRTTKISDDYLTPIFRKFFAKTDLPMGTMDKSKYHLLVEYSDESLIDEEIKITLNEMWDLFSRAPQ